MSVFEYMNILLSILFGVALAHMLTSLAHLIQAGSRVRISWIHAAWVLAVFMSLLGNWISVWDLRTLTNWSVGYILLLVVATFFQYLACVVISPAVPAEGEIDLARFHAEEQRRYLIAFALLHGISVPLNLVTGHLYGVTSWSWQNLAQAPAATLTLAAAFARPMWLQWLLAAAVVGLSAFYLVGLQAAMAQSM